jgi:hypothetical protein
VALRDGEKFDQRKRAIKAEWFVLWEERMSCDTLKRVFFNFCHTFVLWEERMSYSFSLFSYIIVILIWYVIYIYIYCDHVYLNAS